MSAGLGGGSSDAAYTLLGLNKLWELGIEHEELCTIGLSIGSDVPFFLSGAPAIVEERGEKITKIDFQSPSIVLLLVKPSVAVSTAWAYTLFDKRKLTELTKKPLDIKLFYHSLINRDFVSLSTMLDNDLERVVIEEYPVIKNIKEKMLESGAMISSMTGSGPTVFGVFKSKKAAFSAANKMEKHYWSQVTETIV
jgi:4-diphosphocytidyl-2-C-methyl-D-erythritol kinase